MTVRRFLLVLFVVCMLSSLFCRPADVHAQAATGTEQKRPNMLLVTLDTVRADHVGCYGYKRATTPTIDRLAQQGTTFTRAFSNIPWTTPSHFCFLTGAHVARHGSRDNFKNRRGIQGRAPVMISEALQHAGYDTAAFVSGYPLLRRSGLAAGFRTYDDRMQDKLFDGTWKVERRAPHTAAAFKKWWPVRNPGAPWFAWVHFYDAHGPYTPFPAYKNMFVDDGLGSKDAVLDAPGNEPKPPAWTKIADKRQDRQYYISQYDAEIRMVDDALKEIITLLEKSGQLDNTIIVISSDHGEYLGEHGRWFVHDALYSQTLMIPLVFCGPGVPKGGRTDSLAESIDVAPTLLSLAGFTPPVSMTGKKLFTDDGNVRTYSSDYVLSESPRSNRFSVMSSALQWIGIKPKAELYDYVFDPLATKDLITILDYELKVMQQFGVDTIRKARSPWLPETGNPVPQPRPAGRLSEKDREALKSLGYIE